MTKSRLEIYYKKISIPRLKDELNIKNILKIPKIKKVCINSSISNTINNVYQIKKIYDNLITITGQKPIITKAKKSIASFNLRKGMILGCKITLRKTIMYEFLDRMINIALPRIKDFKGIKNSQFDKNGNISIGLKEQNIFPEINQIKNEKNRGLNITIVTNTKKDIYAKKLLQTFNLPLI